MMIQKGWAQKYLPIVAATLLATLVGVSCNSGGKGTSEPIPPPQENTAICGSDAEAVEARITTLLADMTLEEKVGQMHGLQFGAIDDLFHSGQNDRLQIPPFRMVDGPRGVRAGNATAFPVAAARGASWNPELEQQVGEAIGAETRGKGGNVLLAPTMNILSHPRWGRAQETYGEDPVHMGAMAVAFITGAQEHVVASAKHFAANSIENTRFEVDVEVDERTLREVYLPHFRRAVVDARVGTVMSAYNMVNGHYCSANEHLLRDILKGEWGYRGLVVSDWILGVNETDGAALGGLDIEMPLSRFFGPDLVTAVTEGRVPESVIDDAVTRILRVKLCFDIDAPNADFTDRVESDAHAQLALEAARQGAVLLRNEGEALPLDRSTIQDLVVVGPLAQISNIGDMGSSAVMPSRSVTPLAGIMAKAGSVTVTYVEAAEALTEAERATIQGADAVVVIAGLSAEDEGEGAIAAGDRTGLDLSAETNELVATVAGLNPRTVVVLEGGSAMILEPWIEEVEAALLVWYPGQEGGTAIAELLFGEANPGGKLPVSFPRSESDLPAFDNESLTVQYSSLHGYLHLDRSEAEPRYPFGHGLSYTRFDYGQATMDNSTFPLGCPTCTFTATGVLTVSVQVENAGMRAGAEVIQLYLARPNAEADRPLRELKGFQRVQLEPGAKETVTLSINQRDVSRYDMTAGAWVVDPGTYTVYVGSSSRDIRSEVTFQVRTP